MSKTKQNFVYKLIEIITFSQVTIPSDNTTYWCSIHKLPDAFAKKHHVIQVRISTIYITIYNTRVSRRSSKIDFHHSHYQIIYLDEDDSANFIRHFGKAFELV
jgi:uncharacterized membrane protein YwzB